MSHHHDLLIAAAMASGGAPIIPPDQITSTFAWYAAWKETAYSDTDLANTITDFSGNGYNLAATGHAPTYETNELNGLPCFAFRTTDYAAAAAGTIADWKFLHDGTKWAYLCVAKDPTFHNGQVAALLGTGGATTAAAGVFLALEDRSSPGYESAGLYIYRAVATSYTINLASAAESVPYNAYHIIEAGYEYGGAGDDAGLKSNGASIGTQETLNAPSSANPPYPLWIGSFYLAALQMSLDFCEGVLLKEPSAADILNTRQYLANKYGITI